MKRRNPILAAAAAAALTLAASPVIVVQCAQRGGVAAFLAAFKREAAAQGISRRGLSALDGLTFHPALIKEWNRADVYAHTIAHLRTSSAGAQQGRDRAATQHADIAPALRAPRPALTDDRSCPAKAGHPVRRSNSAHCTDRV